MQAQANLSVSCSKWGLHPEINLQAINDILKLTFMQFESFNNIQLSVAVLLTNDSRMRCLNNKYLHKNKPTNVLSFPQFALDYRTLASFKSRQEIIFLGDVAFGHQTLVKEAKHFSISILEHFAHLLIHGTLHLLGFDHQQQDDAEVMESLEENILFKFLKPSRAQK
jgi:probable rRNA maturation factor